MAGDHSWGENPHPENFKVQPQLQRRGTQLPVYEGFCTELKNLCNLVGKKGGGCQDALWLPLGATFTIQKLSKVLCTVAILTENARLFWKVMI